MSFYHYSQNNSGGSFVHRESAGIAHHVIIEAPNAAVADSIGESIGMYWNGCEDGRDCSCCGDRWYPASKHDASEVPTLYGDAVHPGDLMPGKDVGRWGSLNTKWFKDGQAEGFIHYADGRVEGFWAHQDDRKDLEGQYGYGVHIGRSFAEFYLVGKDGWAEDGNRRAASATKAASNSIMSDWTKPKKPVLHLLDNGIILGWYPTEQEAAEVCRLFTEANEGIRRHLRKSTNGTEHVDMLIEMWCK